MQYTTDLTNVCAHLSEDCVRSVFPNFVACYSPLSREQSNSLLQLGIYFWQWNSCFFLNFWKKFWFVLKKSFGCLLRGFYFVLHYVYGFFRRNFLNNGRSFMTSTRNKEGEGAKGTQFWPNLLMVVHGFWGRGFSLCDRKRFLALMWMLSVALLPRG